MGGLWFENGWLPSESVFFPGAFMGGLWFENGWLPSESVFFLGAFMGGLWFEKGWLPSESVFFPEAFMGGLWFEKGWPPSGSDFFRAWVESGWIETTKLIIILGSVAVLLMVDAERLIFPKFFGARVCGTFFQRNAHLPILNLIVALGSLCLVSSSN